VEWKLVGAAWEVDLDLTVWVLAVDVCGHVLQDAIVAPRIRTRVEQVRAVVKDMVQCFLDTALRQAESQPTFHLKRFALVGRTSRAALEANCCTIGGNDHIVLRHWRSASAAVPSLDHAPWTRSLDTLDRSVSCCSCLMVVIAFLREVGMDPPKALRSCRSGLWPFLLRTVSTLDTMGSVESFAMQYLVTCIWPAMSDNAGIPVSWRSASLDVERGRCHHRFMCASVYEVRLCRAVGRTSCTKRIHLIFGRAKFL